MCFVVVGFFVIIVVEIDNRDIYCKLLNGFIWLKYNKIFIYK